MCLNKASQWKSTEWVTLNDALGENDWKQQGLFGSQGPDMQIQASHQPGSVV